MELNTSKERFKQMAATAAPKSRLLSDCLKAFVVGGAICTLGQLISNMLTSAGMEKDNVSMLTSIILVFLASLFTGLGLYQKLGKFAGAGSVVPITGFSNSITAPAIEFKKEGFILGVGAKMFIIAGPVIVYGTLAASIIALIYYFVR